MQFTFPDLSKHEKPDIMTEEGCEKSQFYDPLDMVGGGKRSVESTLLGCRTRCENTPGCAKFSYWADGGCHLQDENAILVPTPSGWSRNVAVPWMVSAVRRFPSWTRPVSPSKAISRNPKRLVMRRVTKVQGVLFCSTSTASCKTSVTSLTKGTSTETRRVTTAPSSLGLMRFTSST